MAKQNSSLTHKITAFLGLIISLIGICAYLVNYGAQKQKDKDYDENMTEWRSRVDQNLDEINASNGIVMPNKLNSKKSKPIIHE
jgi:hypothetical protein